MRLPHALQLAANADIDIAILDVNLDGHMSFAVTEVLLARGVPYIFATGYGSAGIDPNFANDRVVQQPFLSRELQDAITAVAN